MKRDVKKRLDALENKLGRGKASNEPFISYEYANQEALDRAIEEWEAANPFHIPTIISYGSKDEQTGERHVVWADEWGS